VKELQTLIDLGVPAPVIASRLGVSRTAVHYWRRGVCQPSARRVLALALLLADLRQRLGQAA
jgi:DNA-binding transcriptional regulator YdaS (Cro superfamily)